MESVDDVSGLRIRLPASTRGIFGAFVILAPNAVGFFITNFRFSVTNVAIRGYPRYIFALGAVKKVDVVVRGHVLPPEGFEEVLSDLDVVRGFVYHCVYKMLAKQESA